MNLQIVHVGYNRLDHLTQSVRAVACRSKDLSETFSSYQQVIYIDGGGVEVDSIDGVTVTHREENLGLRKHIRTILFEFYTNSTFDALLLLEDDIILSGDWVEFLGTRLIEYKSDDKVVQISLFTALIRNNDYTFDRMSTWGWASWKEKVPRLEHWDELNVPLTSLDSDFYVRMRDFRRLESAFMRGKDIWSVEFQRWMLRNKKLTLYSGNNYVENIGFDGSGENCKKVSSEFVISPSPESKDMTTKEDALLSGYYSPNLLKRIWRRLAT